MRTRYNFNIRVCRACLLDEIDVFECVRDRANEPPSTGYICGFQQPRLSSITQDGLDAPGAKFVNYFSALFDHQKRLAISFHGLCHKTSDTSATDDHRVIPER